MRSHRWRWVIGAAATVMFLAGCAADQSSPTSDDAAVDADALGHVHGLGVDPGDGTLYAASHFGVFRVGDDGSLTRVADRWQDTMAFTVVGPGHFLGSGHPDLSEDLPTHLGLIESVDAAETWSVLSLGGQADFHALDVSGDRIYGYDATTGLIMTTTDRMKWRTIASGAVVDLAADPAQSERVIASAPDGTLRYYSPGSPDPTRLEDVPGVVFLEWPTDGVLVGVSRTGDVYRSDDAAASWIRAGRVPGTPEAFDAIKEEWHVATDSGIYRSDDGGRTWSMLVSAKH